MTVKITKPALNLREELASLRNQGGLPKEDKLYLDDLVTNGTFDNGTTGWFTSSSGGVTGSVVNGEYNLNNTAGGGKGVTQAFKTQAGKTYKITATARKISGNSAFLVAAQTNWGFSDSLAYASTTSSSNVELSVTFKAVGEESYVYLRSDAVGVTVYDNVSVQEVGENLVTNGTFESLSGWNSYGASGSVTSGVLTLTNGSTAHQGLVQDFKVRTGRSYTISGKVTGGTSTAKLLIGSSQGNGSLHNTTVLAGATSTINVTVVPTSANFFVSLQISDANGTGLYESLRVTEGNHQVIQSIPYGYDVKDVYIDGELAREGEGYDYQVQTDGISQWLKPTIEPTATTETAVIGVRK